MYQVVINSVPSQFSSHRACTLETPLSPKYKMNFSVHYCIDLS